MKRLYLLFFLSISCFLNASGQASCTQVLRTATDTYNAGRLHELPEIVKGCIAGRNGDQFNQVELVTAFKLLSQAYIYLEEPEEADKAMYNLLKTDGFFEVNENLDPAEFIALYNKFRTRPVVSVALKFGLTLTFAQPTSLYTVGNGSSGLGQFSPNLGYYGGISAEKIISGRQDKHKITLAPELFFMSKSYTDQDPSIFVSDAGNNSSVGKIKSIYTQNRIDFYPVIQYELFKKSTLNPFIGIAPGISYLSSATNENITSFTDANGNPTTAISGPTINSTKSFNQIIFSAMAMAGIKYRIGSIYITVDGRFQYGFSNITKQNRTNAESLNDYGYQFPDHKTVNVMGTLGAIIPIFIPKKLIK